MKKVLGALVLLGLAWIGYRAFGEWSAYRTYQRFAEAWVHGDRAEALKYGTEEAVTHPLERRNLRGTRSGVIMEAFRGTSYAVQSKDRSPDGGFELEVHQTIFFDTPGVTTAIGGAMWTRFRHDATVKHTEDGWRVTAFDAAYIDMGETRRRS
jgi:hypothetical protein